MYASVLANHFFGNTVLKSKDNNKKCMNHSRVAIFYIVYNWAQMPLIWSQSWSCCSLRDTKFLDFAT